VANPRPISGILKKEQRRLWKTCPGLGMQSLWERAAGPEVAAHTTVTSVRDGVVTVACSSGAWACELKLEGAKLTEKLNALKPPEPVREIRFIHRASGRQNSRK
jgi:predicted nucleic acid-binding Zn ribbon protein